MGDVIEVNTRDNDVPDPSTETIDPERMQPSPLEISHSGNHQNLHSGRGLSLGTNVNTGDNYTNYGKLALTNYNPDYNPRLTWRRKKLYKRDPFQPSITKYLTK